MTAGFSLGSFSPGTAVNAVTSVLVLEDTAPIRLGVCEAVAARSELDLVAACETVRQALDYIEDTSQPLDVAIIDLSLPDGHGTDVVAKVTELRPQCVCLVFTVLADEASIFSALRAGARGYILKESSPEELVEAIFHAETGGAPMSPEVARTVVESFRPDNVAERTGLTPREREILELLCHGTSYSEVADMLHIGRGTVHTHVKNIYRKLDVSSKAEATKVAIQRRLFIP
ncbi:MAG: response regulator transcription factor [Polyangiaceae bacterium]|nr:response regulator transcription factor [Myxococcales bacterium]MCB9588351.1 response regulator transcription factor [Polyangiaceae bacterium]